MNGLKITARGTVDALGITLGCYAVEGADKFESPDGFFVTLTGALAMIDAGEPRALAKIESTLRARVVELNVLGAVLDDGLPASDVLDEIKRVNKAFSDRLSAWYAQPEGERGACPIATPTEARCHEFIADMASRGWLTIIQDACARIVPPPPRLFLVRGGDA